MHILKRDNETGIIYRQWECRLPKAVLLLVHGLGAYSGNWGFLGDFFSQRNFSSYAIGLRGFGEAGNLKGHVDSFRSYFDDIRNLYFIIKKENEGKKIFLLGESLGALISFLMAALKPQFFDGLVCISPAFKSRLKFSILDYVKIFLSLLYNPRRQFNMPFDSGMCTRDLDYQRVMDSDKNVHRLATSRFLINTALAQIRAQIIRNKISIPVLFLLSGEDRLVDTEASIKLFSALKIKEKVIKHYPGMYHALSVEQGREKVFEDILVWLERRILAVQENRLRR